MKKSIKTNLSVDGRRVLKVLVDRYQMNETAALQLMQDGGPALALALLTLVR